MGAPLAAPAAVDVPPPPPSSQAPVAKDEPSLKKTKGHEEEGLPSRDMRRSTVMPRQRALLVAELAGLNSLLQTMQTTSPDRPQVLRRIAEDYVELEYAATVDGANAIATDARREATAIYTKLANDYPNYAQRDEVLYYLAYEEELANDRNSARKRYFELIQKYPQSKYLPNAYLAFGEMFFAEASTDPSKLDLAEQAYNEVVKYPPPANQVYGYAFYMLGQVYTAKGDFPKALSALKKTIDFGKAYPQLSNSGRLSGVARHDLVFAYSQVGDPRAAFNFFMPLSGDGTGEKERTFAMMGLLGTDYMSNNRFAEASAIYLDLRTRDPAHACRWTAYGDDADKALKGMAQQPAALEAALHACGP